MTTIDPIPPGLLEWSSRYAPYVIAAGSPGASSGAAVDVNALSEGEVALDLGPRSVEAISREVAAAGTVFCVDVLGAGQKLGVHGSTLEVLSSLWSSPATALVVGRNVSEVARDMTPDSSKHVLPSETALLLLAGGRAPGIDALRG